MPELPEVERAARVLRCAMVGRTITRVRVLHAAMRRTLTTRRAASLPGRRVVAVERRGKHQLVRLDDGSVLHAHFRMTGDWEVQRMGDPLPRFARLVFELDDGSMVALTDPRALGHVTLHAPGAGPALLLGPEADDPAFTPQALRDALSRRRIAIKPALLDQRIVAGLGNIYAAEALWRAQIDPRRQASALTTTEAKRLVSAARRVLAAATGDRYGESGAQRFEVYDREGLPCRRCRTPVSRITQAGRSTYFCPECQR